MLVFLLFLNVLEGLEKLHPIFLWIRLDGAELWPKTKKVKGKDVLLFLNKKLFTGRRRFKHMQVKQYFGPTYFLTVFSR